MSKEKKDPVVIQVLPALNQGGVERGTIEIAEALQKEGIKNYVISSGGKMVAELSRLGVTHITLPVKTKNPLLMFINSYRLEKIFKETGASLVHVRSRAPAWSVKWAANRMKIPFIATFHGRYGLKPEVFKKAYNRVMTKGKYVIAVSAFIQNHLMKEYNIPDQRIRLIPRGADINKFSMDAISVGALQDFAKEYDIPTDKPIVTLVGRLSRIKGHDVVLDAVAQMKQKEITLLFVGGNAKAGYDVEVKKKIEALPTETTVKVFAVPGDKMPFVYALSDICVQPTLVPESFGRGISEAQAMGRVVVASNHGGACELISNNRTGFLTPVGNSKILASVLDSVLSMTPAERQTIGMSAQESVRNNFSIQKMCDRTIALYKEILNND
ncbi:MAG: glycosyltransferase family 4 protein [Alphaproteobacteria bacterium]|nr:glycosyltransferase family 4 protein [Alphaproteobacteria bacterium]